MSATIVYDKNGKIVPSREFLSMVIILLKKAEHETGGESLLTWLESFAEQDTEVNVDDDTSLRKAVYKVLMENYLNQENNAN